MSYVNAVNDCYSSPITFDWIVDVERESELETRSEPDFISILTLAVVTRIQVQTSPSCSMTWPPCPTGCSTWAGHAYKNK